MKSFIEKKYRLLIALVLFFMGSVSLLNAWNDSAIFDETAHIGAAYSYVSQGEIRLNPEHPPLIKDLSGLPLLFLDLNFDTNKPFWDGSLPGKWDEGQWAAGRYLLYQAGNDPDWIIFWSRFPIVLLSLLLGLFIFRWGKELAGTLAGIIALIFYAFDPNILGHNHFVTTDLGIVAFMTFAFYFYFRFVKNPTWKNVLLAGLFLGLLQLAKFSSIIAFPIFAFTTVVFPLVMRIPNEEKNRFLFRLKKLLTYFGKGALVFLVSVFVVWGVYSANTFRMTQDSVSRIIDANFSPQDTSNQKNVLTNKALHKLNENILTRPLAEYGVGIGYVFRRVAGGNGAYFLGQVSSQAFKAYFPTVFMIKETIPLILMIFFALVIATARIFSGWQEKSQGFFRVAWHRLSHYLRVHIAEASMLLFIALYSYVSITGNLNIGFRHLFPILPFIYILTAKTIANFLKNRLPHHRPVPSLGSNSTQAVDLAVSEERERQRIGFFSPIFIFLFAYLILGTIFAYPYYMSYFNEAVGGPKNGYHYVTDSNADWGQDLKRLRNFLNDHPEIGQIRVDYFGGGDIRHYLGDKYLIWWDSKRPIEAGWYAISTNFMQGSLYDTAKKDAASYRWLKNKKPDYQVGTSLLIYNITAKDLEGVR